MGVGTQGSAKAPPWALISVAVGDKGKVVWPSDKLTGMKTWVMGFRSYLLFAAFVMSICCADIDAEKGEDGSIGTCPAIIVTEPAGALQPGELIRFDVSLVPEKSEKLKFYWTTDKGRVNEGQSTRHIGIRYLMEMRGTSVTATVKIEGLADHCPNSASGSAGLTWDPVPELLADFSVPVSSINRKSLRTAAEELVKNPHSQMYIIEYFPHATTKASSRRKTKMVMTFFTETLKFDGSRVTIVFSEADRPRTRIFRIPPGSDNPTP